jgi:hypothetical protein
MKLSKTDQKVLDVIDGKLPFSVLMYKDTKIVKTRAASRSIEQLKAVGIIYKDNDHILRRTLDLVELNEGFDECEA